MPQLSQLSVFDQETTTLAREHARAVRVFLRPDKGADKPAKHREFCNLLLTEDALAISFGFYSKLITNEHRFMAQVALENAGPDPRTPATKIRVRGRGTLHSETSTGLEASEIPPQISISCVSDEMLACVVKRMIWLIESTSKRFFAWCGKTGHARCPTRLWSFGDMSASARMALASLVQQHATRLQVLPSPNIPIGSDPSHGQLHFSQSPIPEEDLLDQEAERVRKLASKTKEMTSNELRMAGDSSLRHEGPISEPVRRRWQHREPESQAPAESKQSEDATGCEDGVWQQREWQWEDGNWPRRNWHWKEGTWQWDDAKTWGWHVAPHAEDTDEWVGASSKEQSLRSRPGSGEGSIVEPQDERVPWGAWHDAKEAYDTKVGHELEIPWASEVQQVQPIFIGPK